MLIEIDTETLRLSVEGRDIYLDTDAKGDLYIKQGVSSSELVSTRAGITAEMLIDVMQALHEVDGIAVEAGDWDALEHHESDAIHEIITYRL